MRLPWRRRLDQSDTGQTVDEAIIAAMLRRAAQHVSASDRAGWNGPTRQQPLVTLGQEYRSRTVRR